MNATLQQKLLEDAPIAELRRQLGSPTQLLMHVLAGRSILTVRSRKSNDRVTLRFRRPDPVPGKARPIWVSILDATAGDYVAGGTDQRSWKFVGTIWPADEQTFRFRHSLKSPFQPGDASVRIANWVAERLGVRTDELMESAEWWHEGRCGRCGRRLTVPESIESGFGPECIGKVAS